MVKLRTIKFYRPILANEGDTVWTTHINIFGDGRNRKYWSVGPLGLGGIGTVRPVTREEAKKMIKQGGRQEVK